MSERKLKITIHPDIVQICIIFFHNKNFDFNCEKKDSVTLVSENALLKKQKKSLIVKFYSCLWYKLVWAYEYMILFQ